MDYVNEYADYYGESPADFETLSLETALMPAHEQGNRTPSGKANVTKLHIQKRV